MYLIINSECNSISDGVKPLVSEGTALLNLLHCLGYDTDDPPLADLLSKFYHVPGDWLVLSPIQCQATHNDALITAAGRSLEVQEADAQSWFSVFSDYFAAEGMKLHYHDEKTWLLHDPQKHPLKAKPAHRLLNKSLVPELAGLDQTLFWQKFITESQMLFASQPNHSMMNSLWPWGSAKLADKKDTVICADEYFLPSAKLCSVNVNLYSPSIKLKEQHIVLINDRSVLSAQHLHELKKLSIDWYWNDTAYASNWGNWFTRLWRRMIYVN